MGIENDAAPREQEMEKREHPRHTCTGQIIYRQLGPARAGSMQLDLLIFLGERSIRAEAEVVWSQDASPEQVTSCLHRLKFTSLDLQDRLSLELFIAVAFSGKGGAGEAVVKEVRPRP